MTGLNIYIIQVIKDTNGDIVELKCSHVPGTSGGRGPRVKGIIHWVSESHSARATVRLYDRLFKSESPGSGNPDGDFIGDLNPESLRELRDCAVEDELATATPGEQVRPTTT